MEKVQFFYLQKNPGFRDRVKLKQFISKLFKLESKKLGHLSIIFCSDNYLLSINESYLNHSDYTDVISFELSDSPDLIEGEIYISIDRVKENARIFKMAYNEELHRVIFHGLLHLCGYKDKLKSDQAQIRNKEDRYLNMYFRKRKEFVR